MRNRWIILGCLALALALGSPAPLQSATATGLKIPDVPITGGKKLKKSSDGNISGHDPMPGLNKATIVSWETLVGKHFKLPRRIPSPRPQELVSTKGLINKSIVTTIDLPRLMKNLAQKSFTDTKYNAKEEWAQSFGNIMNEFKKVKGDARKTDALLTQLQSKYPQIYKEIAPYMLEMVRDDFLYSKKWDPYKDESVKGKKNDGILFVQHWYMQADSSRDPVWNQNLGEHKVYQGAAIIYTDVRTIKEMEKDYAKYFSQVGQDYMEAYPVQNSHFRGFDKRGNEFALMQLYLRNDLPFPYESASYVMNILEHYDSEGYLLADYYSENKEDLNWMAGRDHYYPIKTTKGELVGNLLVTTLDFDIKNVPERDIDRIVSMKAGLGNMKRISERLLQKKHSMANAVYSNP